MGESPSLRKHEDVAPEDMAHSDHAVVLVHGLKVFSNLNDSVIPSTAWRLQMEREGLGQKGLFAWRGSMQEHKSRIPVEAIN